VSEPTVDVRAVARILEEIAGLLELKGENPFKVRAYENAARALDGLTEDLGGIIEAGTLTEVPGIGEGIALRIVELWKTGRMVFHEDLLQAIPPGYVEMVRIPGLGAKRVRLLGEKLESARLLTIALANGLAFLLLVGAMLPISGGHLNPAVTFAAMLARKFDVTKGILYIVVQCAGAVAGALLLTIIIPAGTHGNLGAHGLGARVSVAGGLTAEIVLTFMLVSAVMATTMGGSRPVALGLAAIGLASTLGYLFAVPLTGGSMNPARSFGPAFVTGVWKDHWIFWIGPLVGGALAAFAHQALARADRRR